MSANAGSTASLLLLLQLGSRLITFTLNQALLSFTTPAAFGTATIQLEPLLNTVLFLCREGIRAALARSTSAGISKKAVYRTSLLPLAFGIPLACAAFALYARSTAHAVAAQPHFRSSVLLYALATLVELASEPYFNRAQMAADVRLRVGIEGSAVIVRAVTTLLVILYGRDKLALLAFAIGQAAYSATLLIRYAWHYRHAQPAQSTDTSESAPDSSILKLAYALTKQSFFKQVLTEGDKVIVSRISPIEDQGGYALALNYGSLVARIIFQPLEESSRLFYSRNIGSQIDGPTKASKESLAAKTDASLGLLRQLIKLQVYLTLAFTCFAPFYTTPLLFHLLRGSRWMNTSAPALLQQYLFLLPLLGLNGILEAFVQAVANESELSRMSYALLAWSGVYCAACYACVTLLNMKEDALLWANGMSMACRIAYSMHFIHKYSERQGTSAGLARPLREARVAVVTSILAIAPLRWSLANTAWQLRAGFARHILLGGLCFAPTLVAGLWSEKSTLQGYLARRKGTKGSKAN